MKKEDKSIVIGQLTETLKEYDNFYLTDIEALNAEKTSALRRLCFKENVKLVVVKNTLFKRALENMDVDYSALYSTLKGNTAVMFSNVVNTPARLIKDFTKGTKGEGKPQLKAAYVQESFYVGVEHLALGFDFCDFLGHEAMSGFCDDSSQGEEICTALTGLKDCSEVPNLLKSLKKRT